MILSGMEIEKRLGGDIVIEPYNKDNLNPNSYNLRLHDQMLVYTGDVLDMKAQNDYKKIRIPEEGLMLVPGQL
jgi:dCTP deaminase